MIRDSFSLSGFGGGYELQCQKMLWRGVHFLEERRPPVEMWAHAKSSPQIYGVVITEGLDLKALEAAIIRPGDDATGAMHHCVMGHLCFIHRNGLNKWAEELAEVRIAPGDRFQFDDEKMEFVDIAPARNT